MQVLHIFLPLCTFCGRSDTFFCDFAHFYAGLTRFVAGLARFFAGLRIFSPTLFIFLAVCIIFTAFYSSAKSNQRYNRSMANETQPVRIETGEEAAFELMKFIAEKEFDFAII